MKKFYLIIFLSLLLVPSWATHVNGGEITYSYVGNSTGVAHQYILKTVIYRDDSLGGAPSSVSLCIASSCYSKSQVILPFSFAETAMLNSKSCEAIIDSLPNDYGLAAFVYQDTVVLPGKCGDFRFSYQVCCRAANIDNMNNPSGSSIVIDAALNNLIRPNSSPAFKYEGTGYFCSNTNRPVYWDHSAIETDGDSLFYRFDFNQGGGCSFTGKSPMVLKSPYTASHPFGSIIPIQISPSSGIITFQPINEQMAMVRITIEEYTFDSVLTIWPKVGEVTRDVILFVSNHCTSPANSWTIQAPGDSLTGANINTNCGNNTFKVQSPFNFLSSSLASDGSDFRMVNSQNQLMPIIGARSLNNADTANLIELEVYNGFSYADSFQLFLRTGSDGNTLLSPCGFEAQGSDSLAVVVSDCNSTTLKERSSPLSAIFPSPVQNFIILERHPPQKGDLWLEITDQRGALLLQQPLTKELRQRIELDQLAAGSYLLLLKSQDGQPLQQQTFFKL